MKISLFPEWIRKFFSSLDLVSVMIIILIFGCLSAIAIPSLINKHNLSKLSTVDQHSIDLKIGDVIYIKALDMKGVINNVRRYDVDILVIGKDGQANVIRYIDKILISK